MRKIVFIILTSVLSSLSVSAQGVKAYEGKITMPTYLLEPAERAPIFDRDWSYQGARRAVYPYPQNDNMTRTREEVTYDCLYMENEYVELCIIPELGGRLMYAVDKTNGYDIFYRNEVVKPANIGMNGAWISGGVEWNVFHHHRQTSFIPCDWRIVSNDDGSRTVWLGETEYRHRMQWAIGVTLYPGKSYIEVSGRLINSTANDNSMLYWSNVSTLVDENYQVIFPQSTKFVTYHSKNSFAHWPITHEPFKGESIYENGVDASWWKNHYMSCSMFVFDQKEDFIGGYDHGRNAGTMLCGDHNIIKGGKFWLWGPNSEWDTKILTDASGHYCELMVGAYSDNQPDYNWSYAYETKQFSQFWYGIRDMGGVKAGDRRAAINMDMTAPGKVKIGANATERFPKLTLVLKKGDDVLYTKMTALSPADPYVETVDIDPAIQEHELTLALLGADGKEMLSYTPVVKDPAAPLPPIVDRPLLPEQIQNTEEVYFVGLRNLQFYNPFVNPVDYFEEVLRRDPSDTRANTQMGVYYRLRGEYEKAANHLRTALRRQTKDYTRPKDTEAMYNLGLVLKAQGKTESAIDTLFRATWNSVYNSAANTQLAQIYAEEGEWAKVLERLDDAVAFNQRNYSAQVFRGSVLEMLGRKVEAMVCWNYVLSEDPTNAYAIHNTASASEFHKFMREQPESYIELAITYWHNGFKDKAVELLRDIDSRVDYPTVKLYLGYLTGDETYTKAAFMLPTAYCYPFRLETIPVLEAAKVVCPESELPYYYLGNLLYNLQPDNAIREWEKCVEINPMHDLAWRNLGWAHWLHTKDYAESVKCYKKAIELNPEAIYLEECDQVFQAMGAPAQERYDLLKAHHKTGAKRFEPLSREVITGTFVGDYDYVLDLLDSCYFPTREGAANFHDCFVDACVFAGRQKVSEGDIDGAIALYLKSFEYPENHQIFLVDERSTHDAQTHYLLGEAYELKGDVEKATEYYEKAAEQDFSLSGSKDFRFHTGLALKKLGRKAEARSIFKKLVEEGKGAVKTQSFNSYAVGNSSATLNDLNAAAYYTQALGQMGLGHKVKAKRLLKKVLKLKPDHLYAYEMLKQL